LGAVVFQRIAPDGTFWDILGHRTRSQRALAHFAPLVARDPLCRRE
jgi:hypothetical protein